MGKEKLKKVELIINEESEQYGVEAISLVEFPAIEENWVFFNRDNFLTLAKLDEEQKTLVGAVLIPDKEIPRFNQETNEEFIVFFSKETIKQAQELFMFNLRNNEATYEHRVPVKGISVIESWIKEDKKYDKSNAYGFEKLPLGTWFVKMKVNNSEVWESVKEGKVRGFSIEGYFTDRLIEQSKPKDILDLAKDCNCKRLDKFAEEILENEISVVAVKDGAPLFATEEEALIYAEMIKGCSGFHIHNIDGRDLYMACENHDESTLKKKKKKKRKKYSEEAILKEIREIIKNDENKAK